MIVTVKAKLQCLIRVKLCLRSFAKTVSACVIAAHFPHNNISPQGLAAPHTPHGPSYISHSWQMSLHSATEEIKTVWRRGSDTNGLGGEATGTCLTVPVSLQVNLALNFAGRGCLLTSGRHWRTLQGDWKYFIETSWPSPTEVSWRIRLCKSFSIGLQRLWKCYIRKIRRVCCG